MTNASSNHENMPVLNQDSHQSKVLHHNHSQSQDLYQQTKTNQQLNNTRELLRQISYLHIVNNHIKSNPTR